MLVSGNVTKKGVQPEFSCQLFALPRMVFEALRRDMLLARCSFSDLI